MTKTLQCVLHRVSTDTINQISSEFPREFSKLPVDFCCFSLLLIMLQAIYELFCNRECDDKL